MAKVLTFLQELAIWIKADKPRRNPKEIKEIFDICKECPDDKFVETSAISGNCAECGCFLKNRKARAIEPPNKIEWGTTRCPLGHWGKEEDKKITPLDIELAELHLKEEKVQIEKMKANPNNSSKSGGCGCG